MNQTKTSEKILPFRGDESLPVLEQLLNVRCDVSADDLEYLSTLVRPEMKNAFQLLPDTLKKACYLIDRDKASIDSLIEIVENQAASSEVHRSVAARLRSLLVDWPNKFKITPDQQSEI